MNYFRRIFFYLFFIAFCLDWFTDKCFSQNLVPNPSFEIYDTCPQDPSRIHYALPWFQPTTGTPDFFDSCFTFSSSWSSNMDVPQNFNGYQNAKSGFGYSGFIASFAPWWNTYREYVQVQLSSPLILNTKYYVSFFVSLSDSSVLATDNIGLYFSNDSLLSSNYDTLPAMPQISNVTGSYISDKIGWTLISGEYIAQGGERFITIGNFKSNKTSTCIFIGGGDTVLNSDYNSAYYYLDDVCISTDSTCLATNVGEYIIQKQVFVFPNPCSNLLHIRSVHQEIDIVEVVNLLGTIMISKRVEDKRNDLEIDIGSFENGIYLIRVFQHESMHVYKINIQH